MVNFDIIVVIFSLDVIINIKKCIEFCKNVVVNVEYNKIVDEIISINGLLVSMIFYLFFELG